MNYDLFSNNSATSQYTFDQLPWTADALQQHWQTRFNQTDVQQMRTHGINALHIPIGFWAYDNIDTPYIQGADAYLEKAVGRARDAGLWRESIFTVRPGPRIAGAIVGGMSVRWRGWERGI